MTKATCLHPLSDLSAARTASCVVLLREASNRKLRIGARFPKKLRPLRRASCSNPSTQMREQAEVSADVLIADEADERRKHACDLGGETQSSFAAARRPHSAARFHNRDFAYGQKPSQQMRNYIVRILSGDVFISY